MNSSSSWAGRHDLRDLLGQQLGQAQVAAVGQQAAFLAEAAAGRVMRLLAPSGGGAK